MGTTPYNCAHCDKSFVRSDVRAKHVQTMHGIGGSGSTSGSVGHKRERDSSTASGSTPPMYVYSYYVGALYLTLNRKQFMADHRGPSPTFSQTHHHLGSSPQHYLHQDRAGSLTLPAWVDTTQSQHQQQQSLPPIRHHDGTNLSGPGSATLFNGGTPLMGGAGGMMLPPPTPFGGTSGLGNGNGNGFLDPSTLSTATLPLDSGKSSANFNTSG